jgi:hypothetical protein
MHASMEAKAKVSAALKKSYNYFTMISIKNFTYILFFFKK